MHYTLFYGVGNSPVIRSEKDDLIKCFENYADITIASDLI